MGAGGDRRAEEEGCLECASLTRRQLIRRSFKSRPQQITEDRVREPGFHLSCSGREYAAPAPSEPEHLSPERGLSDPCFALEQQRAGPRAIVLREATDDGELILSPEDRVLGHD
jgi:hypothetical protein